jgi:tetratricopeptide (TPR) repeat protein
MANRLLNAVVAYADYLRQTVFPENLSVYYPHPGVALTWTAAIVPAIVMVALTLLAIIFRRRRPYLLFGWLWFVGTLVPMIGLVQVGNQQRADRYTYFPLIGVFIAATWFVSDFAQRSALGRRITPVFAFGVLALLGVTAFVQIGYWHDSVRLTRHALACGEDSTTVRIALATGLLARGETTEAIDLLESAVHMDPRDAEARFNLGVGLEAIGRPTDAASQYEAALAIDERDPRSHNNLGAIYWKQHQYANAKQHFFRALQIDPDHVRTYVNLGSLDVETGDYAQAIAASRRALQLDPHLLRCHHNIAMALLAQGYITQAIGELRYILSVAPEDAEAQAKLKMTLAIQRQNPGH